MNVNNEFPVMIFASEFNDKRYYKVGLRKKDVNGEYIRGYKEVRFKKEVFIHNKTLIKIKKAWLDFYVKDKKTIDYIFISDYEIVENEPSVANTPEEDLFEIEDDDLPF